jgi:acetylornithine deacetylase/succinyl-diaminopimelate desuccinylase-like protein
VDCPVWRFVHAPATLTTPNGNTPRVEELQQSFSEPMAPLPEDVELIARLLAHYADKPWDAIIPGLAEAGVEENVDDVDGPDVLRQSMYGSTFNFQGLYAGSPVPGTKTFTIPDRATALIVARLITDLSPEEVIDAIRLHLESSGFEDVQLRMKGGYT